MNGRLRFTIGGIAFSLSREEVEQKLNSLEPENVREVYVEVNGKRFPIKQAFAATTGLLKGGFTTHDAMRVFRKLSFSVGTKIDVDTLPERFYTVLKSLNEFDKREIRGVIKGLLARTDRDNCFIGNYYRAVANVETLLSLKSAKDLQAIAMVARGLLELAVDTKLLDTIPDAEKKILTFCDVEKLRAAKKIVKFKTANPAADVNPSVFDAFITNNAHRIDSERKTLWPNVQKVQHWSGLNLRERVALLKAPFDEIYEVNYPEMSWYVHSGLTGFVNLQASTLNMMAAKQNKLAGECFVVLLTAIIDAFEIEKTDAKIKNKLKLARMLPFTDGRDEALSIEQELLG